jgi:hypothetical protein
MRLHPSAGLHKSITGGSTVNRRKVSALLAGFGFALLGTAAIPATVSTEEQPAAGVTSDAPVTSGEDSATAWDKTKEVSGEAWEATREGSARAWEATKEISADTWEAAREGSARAWDKTREISTDAWEATREGTASAWDEAKGMVQDEQQPEADATRETPATLSP